MSYSLTRKPPAVHVAAATSTTTGPPTPDSSMTKMPRVILHPHGRQGSNNGPGSSVSGTAPRNNGTTANTNSGAMGLSRYQRHEQGADGATRSTVSCTSPAAAAISMHTPPHGPLAATVGGGGGNNGTPTTTTTTTTVTGAGPDASVLRRTEEKIELLQRKLDSMHTDIRMIAAATTPAGSRLASPHPTALMPRPSSSTPAVAAAVTDSDHASSLPPTALRPGQSSSPNPCPMPGQQQRAGVVPPTGRSALTAASKASPNTKVPDSGSGGISGPSSFGTRTDLGLPRGAAHHLQPLAAPSTTTTTATAAPATDSVFSSVSEVGLFVSTPSLSCNSDSNSDGDDDDSSSSGSSGSHSSSDDAATAAAKLAKSAAKATAAADPPPPQRQGIGFRRPAGSKTVQPPATARKMMFRSSMSLPTGTTATTPTSTVATSNTAAAASDKKRVSETALGSAGAGIMGPDSCPSAAACLAALSPPPLGDGKTLLLLSPNRGGRRSVTLFATGEGTSTAGTPHGCDGGGDDHQPHDNAKAVDGLDAVSRRRSNAVRTLRDQFFAPMPRLAEVLGASANDRAAIDAVMLPGTPCSWLCCIALGISFITGVPTTVEKVLKTNHLGIHYIGLQAVTLAQLYDLTSDYLHTRFHRTLAHNSNCADEEFEEDPEASQWLSEEELRLLPHAHCEMATMDRDVIDPVEETGGDDHSSFGMGEHAPVASLAQFRKELAANADDEKSLYMFNYDPYVIEEYETRRRANNAETEEEEAAIWAGMLHGKGRIEGVFGLLVSFNPVQATVTIVTPHMTKVQHPMHPPTALPLPSPSSGDGGGGGGDKSSSTTTTATAAAAKYERFRPVLANMVLEEHTVSLLAMYEALCQRDAYTQLSRGFVRVFIGEDLEPKVPSIFPLFVLDGSSAAGLMTTTLDISVAPHVLGLSMLHHLSVTFLLSDSARRKQSSRNLLNKANVCDVKLRGIPLTKVCQQLRLPLSMIVGQSNKESIAVAFVWYTTFLQQMQVGSEVRLGLVRPTRRGGADDGQPSITEEEFLAHLKTAVDTQSVMLVSFDVNIALNVRINPNPEPAHFAIVIGVDEVRGIVRIADVNVKRFRKTWHIPFYRLYNAVMGYGYMMASGDKKAIRAMGGKKMREELLKCGHYALPPLPPAVGHWGNVVSRFEYPRKAYAITILADAVGRLGFKVDVERFLNYSGFHISYFLSRHLPLEAAGFVAQNYSHYALDDAVCAVTRHYDYTAETSPPVDHSGVISGNNSCTSRGASAGSTAMDGHRILSEADLLADIELALASPATRQLIVKFDLHVIAADTAVYNGSSHGGSYGIVVDYDRAAGFVILNDCDPESYYRTMAVPLPLLFRAVASWDNEDMRARGTLLLTTDRGQEGVYDNTKGYDFAHALVHHPFRPVFSAACSCLALAATEMMTHLETPMMLDGAPLASTSEDEDKRTYKRYNNIFSAEDILYALPTFSVHDWHRHTAAFRSGAMADMANAAFKELRLPLVAVDITRTGIAGYEQGGAARNNGSHRNKDNTTTAADDGGVGGSSSDAGRVLTNPAEFLAACDGVSGLLTVTLLAYDTGRMYGVPGTSVGIVNRVETYETGGGNDIPRPAGVPAGSMGSVQVLEGEPCRWGAVCERTAEDLMSIVTAVLCIMEVVDDDDGDNNNVNA